MRHVLVTLCFTLLLHGVDTVSLPLQAGTAYPLVPSVGLWRYLDDGSDQGTGWRAPAFDDSEWPEGPAELGYGDGDETTTVSFGPNENDKHITTYFRRAFEVSNPEAITNLSLEVLRDDGAVVYLNGEEVFRNNLPAGGIDHRTLALSSVSDEEEEVFLPVSVGAGRLLRGRNVLAAEVHQSSPDSSDLSFNLRLMAIGTNDPPAISIVTPPNNTFLAREEPVLISVKATDPDGGVVRVEFFDGNVKLGERAEPPFDWLWTNAFSGSHTLTAIAHDTSGLERRSEPARVLVGSSLSEAGVLISAGSQWRYWDQGGDLGTAWRHGDFDDGAWLNRRAELGYGDGDEVSLLKFGGNPFNKHITTYFRHRFEVEDLESIEGLRLRLLRDDGGIVYLNGEEVFRSNMPGGPVGAGTPALRSIDFPEEAFFFSTTLSPSLLVPGTNLVAVELHQADPATSDASFDLELQSIFSPVLTRGPWLQNGAPGAVTVKWRTDVPSTARVAYGTDPANLDLSTTSGVTGRRHEVRLTGLTPGTLYYYAVGSVDRLIAGGPAFRFKCPPPVGEEGPHRLWVLGDSGTATVDAQNVRNAYLRESADRGADVLLMLGDNAYQTGTDVEYQAALFDMYPSLLRQSILWSTIGNHDTAFLINPPPTIPYFEIYTHPTQGEAGGVPSGTEQYYSFDYGNIHFICLDSMTSRRDPLGPMLAWLENDLAATAQRWLIAFWHHAPYTRGNHDSDFELEHIEMRRHVVPVLEAHGVDLVLSGHTHSYERSMMLHGHYGFSDSWEASQALDPGSGRVAESGAYTKFPSPAATPPGTVYVVAGSSGKTSGGLLNHPAMFLSLNRLGSLVIDVEGGRLDLRMLRETGEVGDTFTLIKDHALTISDAVVAESSEEPVVATFEVRLSAPRAEPLAVAYATHPVDTIPGLDYFPTNGLVTFAPGETVQTIQVAIRDDDRVESNEVFRVRLDVPGDVLVAKQNGFGTILDNEAKPGITVHPASGPEGTGTNSEVQVQVSLSRRSQQVVKVRLGTISGAARMEEDFVGANLSLTFVPNELQKSVPVTLVADEHAEPDEAFAVRLSEPLNGVLQSAEAEVTILNDDGPAPVIQGEGVEIEEGDFSFRQVAIPLQLSRPSGLLIRADVATRDGTAVAPADYPRRTGTISFFPGTTNYLLRLFVVSDTVAELDESFFVDLSNPDNAALGLAELEVVILNDDGSPFVTIESIQAEEGRITLRWRVSSDVLYQVESTGSLTEPDWRPVTGGAMVVEGGVAEWSDALVDRIRFYRVVEEAGP